MKQMWTEAEDEIARGLIAANAPDSDFHEHLGRTKTCAKQRMDRIRYGRITGQQLIRPTTGRVEVPEQCYADMIRRATAPRSITAVICGDPAPGFTALDRKLGRVGV